MTEETDEIIAVAIQQGDTDAFGILISRYEEKLKRYARRFLAREEDVSDLVQDVFIKAYEHIQSFDTTQRFSPWIYRIAHNSFVNELRRKDRWGMVFDADTILPALPGTERTDALTLDAEQQRVVEQALTSLPAKYREVVVLHYFENLSYQEISDILHVPVNTVGVRLSRARQSLETLLIDHIS